MAPCIMYTNPLWVVAWYEKMCVPYQPHVFRTYATVGYMHTCETDGSCNPMRRRRLVLSLQHAIVIAVDTDCAVTVARWQPQPQLPACAYARRRKVYQHAS